jgi:hypothetical protein
MGFMEEKRGAVPPFPLDVLPPPWRDWIDDTASSAGAPVDYVVQTVLAAVSGLCGAGAKVSITPAWSEPMVLWQAVVGEPSTGKSAALAPMRGLLGTIEKERRAYDGARREQHEEEAGKTGSAEAFVPSQVVVNAPALGDIAAIARGNPRGVILWRDDPSAALGPLGDEGGNRGRWLDTWAARGTVFERGGDGAPLRLDSLAVGILDTVEPDRLQDALEESDVNVAARLLYVWPGPQPHRALASLKPPRDEEALKMLRRLSRQAGSPDSSLILPVDPHGIKAFDAFLVRLNAERRNTEGLEKAWLGKGGSTVARLAGALELLAWSGSEAPGRPGHLGGDHVERAVSLWMDYFRPHGRAVFDRAAPPEFERRVRRAVRWLKGSRARVLSREDIRCQALSRSVTAEGAQQVLYRLESLGIVRPDLADDRGGPGRPARRWQVNPALADR